MANLSQSILNWLYHTIYKKPLVESDTINIEEKEETIQDNTCKIVFIMHDGGDIEIDMDWPLKIKDIKNMASNYAALISVINYGGFKEDIKKLLIEAKTKHSDNKSSESYKFLSYTLSRMSEAQRITDLNSDNPIIGPTQVFAYNNNK